MSENRSVKKVKSIELSPATHLKTAVWHIRVAIRDTFKGKDVLDSAKPSSKPVHRIYRKADDFIGVYFPGFTKKLSKRVATKRVRDVIDELGYKVVEINEDKPWGAYYRLANEDAERFVSEFFPGLSMNEARLGHDDIELSPKFLLVSPGERLSWQLHHRRAERWRFLNKGAYYKSVTDDQGKRVDAEPDTVVQFEQSERHRLCSSDDQNYTLVAEIWQHTNSTEPSDEQDIIRLQDDYSR